jgi:hypothetical protein
MSTENREGVPISAIHLDLVEQSLTLEADDKPVAKLVFSSGVIYFQMPSLSPVAAPETAPAPLSALAGPAEQTGAISEPSTNPEIRERDQTVILSGRLKSKPREGKPDARGNPTAWARFAAHEDGREQAHLYSASFHRHTARIALELAFNAAITVEGYRHVYHDPERLDTLSVIRMLSHPGHPSGDAEGSGDEATNR